MSSGSRRRVAFGALEDIPLPPTGQRAFKIDDTPGCVSRQVTDGVGSVDSGWQWCLFFRLRRVRCGLTHAGHRAKLITFHHFDVEDSSGHTFEEVAILAKDPPRGAVRVAHDAFHLCIDHARGVFRVRTAFGTDRDVEEATA